LQLAEHLADRSVQVSASAATTPNIIVVATAMDSFSNLPISNYPQSKGQGLHVSPQKDNFAKASGLARCGRPSRPVATCRESSSRESLSDRSSTETRSQTSHSVVEQTGILKCDAAG
jgi:hypothetical protein